VQWLATAQCGIRTEIDALVAKGRLRRFKSCSLQVAIFQALRSMVGKDHLALRMDDMTRSSLVPIEVSQDLAKQARAGVRPLLRAKRSAATETSFAAQRRFSSVSAALESIAALYARPGDPLIVTASAFESARSSDFMRPDDVFDALEALAQATKEWHDAPSGSIGQSFQQRLRELGYDEKFSSTTAMSKWQRDYEVTVDGRSVLLSQHLTLGSGGANTCMSIHWYRDESARRTIVGHCGKHLRNSLS